MSEEQVKPNTEIEQTGRKGVDWQAAYLYYCEKNEDGTLKSLRDVAEAFDVNLSYVAVRSKRESWNDNRANLYQKQNDAVIESQTAEIVEANTRHLNTWKSAQSIVLRLMRFYSDDLTEAEALKKEKKPYKAVLPNPYRVKATMDTLETTIKGERVVLGLPNEVTRADINNTIKETALTDEDKRRADEALARINKHLTDVSRDNKHTG
jgi:hypothetical protein